MIAPRYCWQRKRGKHSSSVYLQRAGAGAEKVIAVIAALPQVRGLMQPQLAIAVAVHGIYAGVQAAANQLYCGAEVGRAIGACVLQVIIAGNQQHGQGRVIEGQRQQAGGIGQRIRTMGR